VRDSDWLAKEITMDRIEFAQSTMEVCAAVEQFDVRWPRDSRTPLHAFPRGEHPRSHRDVHAHGDGQFFLLHRPRLLGIAHRMLGSRADAEDLVQDVYLRWHQTARRDIESPLAFLITITTRLCLDRLRELKRERAEYTGPWLYEPVVDDHHPSPEMQLELSEEVSIALCAVLERLGPVERAAFLLHDVFDYAYPEVGRILGKTESACRQMIHRARARLRDSRARFQVTQESRDRVLKQFLAAISKGGCQAVMALLAEEVECMVPWIDNFSSADTMVTPKRHDRSVDSLRDGS
jgi:RNA polymerase sigma factor (sigma-70 family)